MNELNSKFKSMFDIGKSDIDAEYSDTLQKLKEDKQKSFETFWKSPERLRGSPGFFSRWEDRNNKAFGSKTAAAKKDYLNKIKKLRFFVQQRQAGTKDNEIFNNSEFLEKITKKK